MKILRRDFLAEPLLEFVIPLWLPNGWHRESCHFVSKCSRMTPDTDVYPQSTVALRPILLQSDARGCLTIHSR
jgi:hypothetical protein